MRTAAAPVCCISRGRAAILKIESSLICPVCFVPGDLLVLNSSRVFPARLYGRRAGLHAQPLSPRNPASRDFLHGRVEVMLTRQLGPLEWQALVRPGRKIGVGEKIFFSAEDSAVGSVSDRAASSSMAERCGFSRLRQSAS